jgi:hypothetical protein
MARGHHTTTGAPRPTRNGHASRAWFCPWMWASPARQCRRHRSVGSVDVHGFRRHARRRAHSGGFLVQAALPLTKSQVQVERPQRSEDVRPGPAASNGDTWPRGRLRCRPNSATLIMTASVERCPNRQASAVRFRGPSHRAAPPKRHKSPNTNRSKETSMINLT